MNGDIYALIIYVTIGSITPGPNNLMLLQGGIKAGARACIPHVFGIASGSAVMVMLSYIGITSILLAIPQTLTILKIIGTSYLLWLTWHMWIGGIVPSDKDMEQASEKSTWQLPLNFWQAALFQYINPKAWTNTLFLPTMCTIIGTNPAIDNIPIALLYFVINISCISIWAIGGNALKKILHKKVLIQIIHTVIILMTLYCAVAMWL